MRFPHPIRARHERRKTEFNQLALMFGSALHNALTNARPKIEYTVRHAPRPKPDQLQVKGTLRDGQPVYIDAVELRGQRSWFVPMRSWLVEGDNPLDRLEIVLDYFNDDK